MVSLKFTIITPRDRSLPVQLISIREAQLRKKPTNLCVLRGFLKEVCRSCFMIIKSWVNKSFVCARCVMCVSFSVHLILTYYVRKGSWIFYLDYPQIKEARNSDHVGWKELLKGFHEVNRFLKQLRWARPPPYGWLLFKNMAAEV